MFGIKKVTCPACQEPSKVWDAQQNLLVSYFKSDNDGAPTMILVQGNEAEAQSVTIKINYCPWCGRKLA